MLKLGKKIHNNHTIMTERTNEWREIFTKIIEDNGYYEFGKVNFYNLASILEDLYVENQDLKTKVETLEKDIQLLKSYAWEQ